MPIMMSKMIRCPRASTARQLASETRQVSLRTKSYAKTIHSGPSPAQRHRLLQEIYAPCAGLQEGSTEYNDLAKSGKCWTNYANPTNQDKYKALEKQYSHELGRIDSYRKAIKMPIPRFSKTLVLELAHQSCKFQGGRLPFAETQDVAASMNPLFRKTDIGTLSAIDLSEMRLPATHKLQPHRHPNQVAELRNQIVASHWVAEGAARDAGTPGLSEGQLRSLSSFIMRDTESEALYQSCWGESTSTSEYRKMPVRVRSSPLSIYPYHVEVPSLMKEFFIWRNNAHEQKQLHPLLLVCHMMVYFLSIRPFLDRNKIVARMLVHDYLVRQGYFPPIFQGVRREEYMSILQECEEGKPDAFVDLVVSTQLDMMITFFLRWRGL